MKSITYLLDSANFRVFSSLIDLFGQLADHGALVGRHGSRIIIAPGLAPPFFFDELESHFLTCSLTSDTGQILVFSRLVADLATETILLDAEPIIRSCVDFAGCPGLPGLQRLFEMIPQVGWGSKPEPPKIPSADQRGLSRARSMG